MLRVRHHHLLPFILAASLVACGGGSGSTAVAPAPTPSPVDPTPPVTPSPGSLSQLAGDIGGPGSNDGVGGAARFDLPYDVAVDNAGNAYVADAENSTIRKISATGVVTTLAGAPHVIGTADGTGAAANFNIPHSIAVDADGTLYVADRGNYTIRKISPSGVVTTLAGAPQQDGWDVIVTLDGSAATAKFGQPEGLAIDAKGTVYVADGYRIRKISGGMVSTLAGAAPPDCIFDRGILKMRCKAVDGNAATALFAQVSGLAVDASGIVYVADLYSVRKVTADGTVSTVAGQLNTPGSADGVGAAAGFAGVRDIAFDRDGNLIVIDQLNAIRKVTPAGVVTTVVGANTQFYSPRGLATDASGNVFVADTYNHAIRKISAAGAISTVAGAPTLTGTADGAREAARFNAATKLVVDAAGTTYVADRGNGLIRKITAAGAVSTLAGRTEGVAVPVDGLGAAAKFASPQAIAVDKDGNVYVGDPTELRKVTPAGQVTTMAGNWLGGEGVDGVGKAARFNNITGLTFDANGNLLIADANCIRRMTPDGTVATLVGKLGTPGAVDGSPSTARFGALVGLAIDAAGNLYVADAGNNAIRKITPDGTVSTVAGGRLGVAGTADGTGAGALFSKLADIAVDATGAIYVAESETYDTILSGPPHTGRAAIRKLTAAGVVTTVVGGSGELEVKLGKLPASLAGVHGIAAAAPGVLYITSAQGVLKVEAPQP